MDLGCTYHMCLLEMFFETLRLKEEDVVLLGNNTISKAQCMRSIRLKMFDNCEILLQDFGYVLKLKRSFFYLMGLITNIEQGSIKF